MGEKRGLVEKGLMREIVESLGGWVVSPPVAPLGLSVIGDGFGLQR